MNRAKILTAMMLGLWCGVACAQQTVPAAGMGTVTGHVTCGDTQRPARFAAVTLFGVPKEATAMPKMDPNNMDSAAMMAAMKAAMEGMRNVTMKSAQTDINGAFVAADVAPGDYYVFAAQPGYVLPMSEVQAALDGGADVHKLLPGIPLVHVVAEHTANADVTIERGAAVSGTVMWDDGTPMSGAHVAVVAAKGEAKQPPTEFEMLAASGAAASLLGITDDLGRFRVAGLTPGEYDVQATLPIMNVMNLTGGRINMARMLTQRPLVIFAPAAFHKSDAKPITLGRAEDHRDVLITVNLGGMHSVSGRVGSAEDHHGLNEATVRVTDAQDKGFVRSASVDAAGNFTVTEVPTGTYELTVTEAADTVPDKEDEKDKDKETLFRFSDNHAVRSYEDAKQSLIVTESDVAGLNIELTPSKTVRKEPELDMGVVVGGAPR